MSWSRKSSERLRKKRWAKEKRERDRLSKNLKGKAGHRQCGRKGRYPDEISALLAAQQMSQKYGSDMYTYHCDICGGWHLTKRRKGGQLRQAD